MEKRTRVYPAERAGGGWLGKLILFLSAVVILSGLFFPEKGADVSIRAIPAATPIPLDESFDDTPSEVEITLPSSAWYALQLGAFEQEEAAVELAGQYTRRGAGGYVWKDDRYRPMAAVYPERDDAQSVKTRLMQQHRVETYLYEITLPSIQLRLSGMKGQTEILEAAFIHASDLVFSLYELSSRMDRQELNTEECAQELSALSDIAQAVSLRLSQRFVKPRPEPVKELIQLFEGIIRYAQAFNPQDSAVSAGAGVKYQTLSTLYMLKHVYDTISHT